MTKILLLLLLSTSLFSSTLTWHKNYNTALETVKKSNTPLMLFITMPGCRACDFMKDETFHDKAVQSYLQKHFVLCEVNIYDKQIPKKFKAFATPTFEFINGDENRVGDTIRGGREAWKFLENLEEVIEELPYRVIEK